MRLGTLRSCFMFCSVLIFTSPAQAQRKAPPDPARPKIRAITAFINLDRAQYQQQVADAMTMLKRARTVFESRDYEVQTIRISTQPFPEYTKGLTTEQALAFFKNYDALAEQQKFRGQDFAVRLRCQQRLQMRRHDLEHINWVLSNIVTKKVTIHRHVVAQNVQTSARHQRRKNAGVAKVCSQGRDGGEMQRALDFQTPQNEVGVIDQTAMPYGDALGQSG